VVDRDAVQPRAELAVATEAWQGLRDLHENLLRRVLGIGMVEEHPEREVEDPGLVTDQEGLEGLPIAGTDRLQEHSSSSPDVTCVNGTLMPAAV